MKKIVLYTAGTLGDHLPFIVLGKALSDRGHAVRMAVNSAMVPYVSGSGLEAVVLTDVERGPEEAQRNAWAWDHWNNPFSLRHPKAEAFDLEQYVAQIGELADLCVGSDLLVSTAIRHQGFMAHAVTGIPWLTLSLNPSHFKDPKAVLLRNSRLEPEEEFTRAFSSINSRAFSALGVDRKVPPWRPGWLLARHILIACSPAFATPDYRSLQPEASIDMTGFFFYEDPAWEGWKPDEKLEAFLARRPLVLAFSSQPLESPGKILDMHVRAARMTGLPLLVQSGWAGFSEKIMEETAGEDVMFAPFLPQEHLFARAAASIQHGGIGSIARALRAGCPLLIEPFGNDQHDNAQRVFRLGAGTAVHPFETSAEEIARLLEGRVLRDGCRERAREVGAAIGAEDGPGEACRLVETYIERVKRGSPPSPGGVPSLAEPESAPPPVPSLLSSAGGKKDGRAPMEIPKLIHQTWKTADVPPETAAWQETWKRHHPGWEYRLWTDGENAAFIERHYPWFLPIYRNYPEEIMRVDAVRYFLMYHYGGVYADLDYECLRPFGPLLEGKGIVLTVEPEGHGREHYPEGLPFEKLVCNAVLASVPGHPFWEHVIRKLVECHLMPGALDATGPFLLSRARETFEGGDDLSIEPADLLNPVDNQASWEELSAAERREIAATAYGIHHWAGKWWRPLVAKREREAKVSLLLQGSGVSVSMLDMESGRNALARSGRPPKISCLMVTADRAGLARRAVHCFRRQSWENRELVIVDDGKDGELEEWIGRLNDEKIVFHRLLAEGKTLGELRNIAAGFSTGDWVTQWDDDDLSDPLRLEIQLTAAAVFGADGCFLERHTLWWPESRRLAFSVRRLWEGSFLCRREILPRYPHIRKGEDTPVIERIVAGGRIALLDLPDLYTYVFHGENTFEAGHWEAHWKGATEVFGGSSYGTTLRRMSERLKLDLTEGAGREELAAGKTPAPRPPEAPPPEVIPPAALPREEGGAARSAEGGPRVLVLCPVKNAAGHLPGLRENIAALTYPKALLSFGFLESDSSDGTYEAVEKMLPGLKKEYRGAVLVKEDFGYRPDGPRWAAEEQYMRRSIMAKSRNRLLAAALGSEDWVLWIDSDVSGWPPDVIERLLACGKEIVVPNCLKEGTAESFDLNTFKVTAEGERIDWSGYVIDGILQPPKGLGRLYLSDLRERDCVEVDGVGGTMLLVRADLHREGLVFPPFSYRLHIETEGLAYMARDMGHRCWGLPNLEITHP